MTAGNTSSATNSAIVTDYRAKTPGSGALFARAHKVLPSGITHDGRYLDPYSIHVGKAKGPRKWDVDGNEVVDFMCSWGPIVLGHHHPAVEEAVRAQARNLRTIIRYSLRARRAQPCDLTQSRMALFVASGACQGKPCDWPFRMLIFAPGMRLFRASAWAT